MPFKLNMHKISKKQDRRVEKIRCPGYTMPEKRCLMRKTESIMPNLCSRIRGLLVWIISVASFCLSSCSSTKNADYFKGIKNDTTLHNIISKDFKPKIQKGDLLGITVSSLSPENTTLYNAPQNAEGSATGFLVDSVGNINFFKLGSIHAAGLTRSELKEELQKELVPYLAQTVVAVGFLNRHITLFGGGISSQVLPIPNDNMTILDAIATAGDIGEKGNKEQVMVIRENGNSRVFKKLDLTDESVFYSPYFYLQPDDIIYIRSRQKKQNIGAAQIVSYITTAISLYLLIFTRIIK